MTAARLVTAGMGARGSDLSGYDWCMSELAAAGLLGLADGILLEKARACLAAGKVDAAKLILQARLLRLTPKAAPSHVDWESRARTQTRWWLSSKAFVWLASVKSQLPI